MSDKAVYAIILIMFIWDIGEFIIDSIMGNSDRYINLIAGLLATLTISFVLLMAFV